MPSELRAIVIAALLVAFAAGVGVTVGQRARQTPTPRAVPSPTTTLLPSATPIDPVETERRAFAQPLSSGCATRGAVWIVADGGAAIRWDGRTWTIPDPTLRSLVAAQCDERTMLAVGAGGSLLTIDEDHRHVRADRFGIDDFAAVARVPGGAVAVGSGGAVAEQGDLGWRSVAAGATEDLSGVTVSRTASGITGWLVGAGGAAYRFADGRWRRVETGTTTSLRAVAQVGETAIAVGDGVILRSRGDRWDTIPAASGPWRAAGVVGADTVWVVGDRGHAIEWSAVTSDGAGSIRAIHLGTTCTLRSVFTEGPAVWIVGSDGTRGGAWRIAPGRTDRWGTC